MIFYYNHLISKKTAIVSTLLFLFCITVVNAQDQSRPNIVLITTDQQMAKAMSFRMGKKWINTPTLDKLASSGAVFTRAYAANPLCAPSRNSMITGQYPHVTGIQANNELASWNKEKNIQYWTGKDFRSMGDYFKKAGYSTAYFGKWHLNYDPKDSEINGFEYINEFKMWNIDQKLPGAVDGFLKKNHKKPLFLWASFNNPHNICQWSRFQRLPNGPIDKLPPIGKLPPEPDNLLPPKNETPAMTLMRKSYHNNLHLFPVGDYSHFDWRRLAWGYYRLIEKVDARINELLQVLKENGYDKNTLIVFTSDHGESLGAHLFTQKTVFYEESTRVPLIFSHLSKIPKATNNTLVNTGTDLLPTLLDFAHIKVPKSLPGISLKPIALQKQKRNQRSYIVVENKMNQGGPVNGETPVANGRMVRGQDYKYCLYDILDHREALFDLKNDPGETVNIAEKRSSEKVLKKYRGYLKEFAEKNRDTLALEMLKKIETPKM